MKKILFFLLIIAATDLMRATIFTNSADADSFVRANVPTANYGGGGALSVSGSTATNTMSGLTNGIADTFIRFNTAAMVTNFNTLFGTNNWVIGSAKLQVTEMATPNNNIFDQGKGAFAIYWIANDNWTEGSGMPNTPTTDGIVYTNEPTLLTNTLNLGTFTNTSSNTTLLFPLALPATFVSDAQAGGEVSFYLTAIDPQIGFTFNSRSFGTVSARPYLEISAAPRPGITAINLAGTNLIFSATNGIAGGNYFISTTTNLALPLNQWTLLTTNILTTSGNFIITVTNAINANGFAQQFFILQTQ